MGSEAQIEIFGQRVALPAPRVLDRRAAPDAAGSVEGDGQPKAGARHLLDPEMPVEQPRLDTSQQRLLGVEVGPTRLDQGEPRLAEQDWDGAPQEIRRRDEVRIEDRDEGGVGAVESSGEGAGLERCALSPVHELDAEACALPMLDSGTAQGQGAVGAVIEHPDLEVLTRPVERRDGR